MPRCVAGGERYWEGRAGCGRAPGGRLRAAATCETRPIRLSMRRAQRQPQGSTRGRVIRTHRVRRNRRSCAHGASTHQPLELTTTRGLYFEGVTPKLTQPQPRSQHLSCSGASMWVVVAWRRAAARAQHSHQRRHWQQRPVQQRERGLHDGAAAAMGCALEQQRPPARVQLRPVPVCAQVVRCRRRELPA